MQLSSLYFRPPGIKTREFEMPAYSPLEFIRAMQVSIVCITMEPLFCYLEQIGPEFLISYKAIYRSLGVTVGALVHVGLGFSSIIIYLMLQTA